MSCLPVPLSTRSHPCLLPCGAEAPIDSVSPGMTYSAGLRLAWIWEVWMLGAPLSDWWWELACGCLFLSPTSVSTELSQSLPRYSRAHPQAFAQTPLHPVAVICHLHVHTGLVVCPPGVFVPQSHRP